MSDTGTTTSLRDHAREAVRAEVQRQAWLLFSEHGFEATTVDRIAAASGAELVAVLRDRPAEESPWTALRAAFQLIIDQQSSQSERSRRLQLMLRDEPAVRATVEEWRRRWTALLSPAVAVRLPGTDEA